MRLGKNPMKETAAPATFEPVVLAVITHLTTNKYHKDRMEVVRTCFDTMLAGVHKEHTLLVWDNGSCAEMRDYLQNDLGPDVLILSGNVGKTTARTSICRMFPPETIIAYSDDDFFFYDNWLAPQLKLLNKFPNVAIVSGNPIRTAFRWGIVNTCQWAQKEGELEIGRFIPREWEDDFCLSIGREPAFHINYTDNDKDYRVTYKGMTAYCTAHHAQFVARAGVVGRIVQYDGKAMSEERTFDIAMDQLGLRLCTTERYSRHIGNVMDDRIRAELLKLESIKEGA